MEKVSSEVPRRGLDGPRFIQEAPDVSHNAFQQTDSGSDESAYFRDLK